MAIAALQVDCIELINKKNLLILMGSFGILRLQDSKMNYLEMNQED